MDPAFVGAGQRDGLELWRVEALKVVKQPECDGKFHEGDSYILLRTKEKPGAKEWHVHFWLGKDTSQDEMGVAAIKTVELDDALGGSPMQHRELQGSESQLFLSYFKDSGVEYLPGGVASGFKKVDPEHFEPRLLHVKGRRTVRVNEVELKNSSLNTGDVFILDLGMKLYIWNGPECNRHEKAKGIETATNIDNNDRMGRAVVILMDDEPENEEFWTVLGGQIQVTNPGESDDAVESKAVEDLKIFSMDALDRPLPIEGGKLDRGMLEEGKIFLIDTGHVVYVWVGKTAPAQKRKDAMKDANIYLNRSRRHSELERVVSGCETQIFKQLFHVWDPPRKMAFGTQSSGIAQAQEQMSADDVDIADLRRRKQAEDQPVDDGSGTIQVWAIEGKGGSWDKVEVPPDMHGQFFGGDSYIVLYTYVKDRKEEYIIYFWQGQESTNDEKAASALLTKELDDSMGGAPVQCRVIQGKEPAHFRSIFKGRMIVHSGGKASGFRNTKDTDSKDTDGTALFHVKGSNPLNTFAQQVEEVAGQLNSGDCFVLVTPETVFVWKGSGASDLELQVSRGIAVILQDGYLGHGGRSGLDVAETEEPDAFWQALGGKAEYAHTPVGDSVAQDPRLYRCTNCGGRMGVEEIVDFTQSDLEDGDVYVLDVGTSIFVWVGSGANAEEKRFAQGVAQRFLQEYHSDDTDMPIMDIVPKHEPLFFTQHFIGWNPDLFNAQTFKDPYEAKRAALKAAAPAQSAVFTSARASLKSRSGNIDLSMTAPAPAGPDPVPVAPSPAPEAEEAPVPALPIGTFFPLQDLQGHQCPPGVPPNQKEKYLSDTEFKTVMGMDKAAFEVLKDWKKKQLKEKAQIW